MAQVSQGNQPTVVIVDQQGGPNIVVRFLWWLFIGSWASALVILAAWAALVSIVGLPLALWLIDRLPFVLTLRPRSSRWAVLSGSAGTTVVRTTPVQRSWLVRLVWLVLVGWWASLLWMAAAWLVQLTVVGLPVALWMFNRTPAVVSLYRY
jgi:uncharacterized membrane protein YccF (DUF307 family)